jgi:MYXO-CTERM domain-containing protein
MRDVDEGSSNCGVNIIGSRGCCNVNRYRNGYDTGRILSHEVGHGLGMLHDGGNDGGEYFNGFSDFQWTPLMGNVWPGNRWDEALYQWSKGEYTSATRQEDDFANINRHVEYRDDDIPETVPLKLEGTSVPIESNWGQIARNTDSDGFTFSIGSAGGRAELRIDRIEYIGGAMLDVAARIENASGMVMAEGNEEVARYAELAVDLPAGDYTLIIHGGAEGTPAHGFSNYSSVGFYGIEGTIVGATGTTTDGAGGMGGSTGAGGASTGAGAMGGAVGTVGGTGVGGTPGVTGVGGSITGGGGSSATITGGSTTTGQGGATGAISTTGGSAVGGPLPSTSSGTGVATAGASDSTLGGGVATTGGTTAVTGYPGSPPPVESGCACRTGPTQKHPAGLALALLGFAALFSRRRRP